MRFYVKMVNGKMKKVKLISADSQESIEMEEYSDEDDEVFVRNNRNGEAGDAARRPLMKKKKVSICQTCHEGILYLLKCLDNKKL